MPSAPRRAALYDWECAHVLGRTDDELPWLITVANATGGPALELACGTGRVTVPLATATGLPIVGLDVDREMLLGARTRGARYLVQADMRTFAFARHFRLIVVAYNSLQLLDVHGADACVAACVEHLQPDGALAVECTDFQHDVVTATVAAEELGRGRLPTGEELVLTGSLEHDLAARTSTYRRQFTVEGVAFDDVLVIRSIDAAELVALMEHGGLKVDSVEQDGARTRCVGRLSPS